jgi:succinoglycan biosynthesis protein ExoM
MTVAICTYKRNEPLAFLISKLREMGQSDRDTYSLGVVIVDDNADQRAKPIAQQFEGQFENGVHYVHSGAANISTARNLAIETGASVGDWVAMTDDDCEPSEQWLAELLAVQARTGADVVSGGLTRRAGPGSPKWIAEQPFLSRSQFEAEDGEDIGHGFTNNSMISAAFINTHKDVRFRTEFGKIGGEDTVFFREVKERGAKMVWAQNARMFENEEEERLSYSYQLRRFFWYGNSSSLTSLRNGQSRPRMAVHSIGSALRAFLHPVKRLAKGQKPQFRYFLALISESCGKFAGVCGIRVSHK